MKSILILLIFILPYIIYADEKKSQVGIDEKLGEYVPGDITFFDEFGKTVQLKDLMNGKPAIITLVYFRCPGICSPLLTSLAKNVDMLDLEIGKDYNIITISFDTSEDYVMAAEKKKNYFNTLKVKKPGTNDWRFLTADSVNVARITDAVGFRFIKQGNDFIHSGVLTVLSPDGKIVRYLYGNEFLPFDLKLSLIEASEGRVGSTISKVVKLCYSYDVEGRKYMLNVTRIAGAGILFILGTFAGVLIFAKKRNKKNN